MQSCDHSDVSAQCDRERGCFIVVCLITIGLFYHLGKHRVRQLEVLTDLFLQIFVLMTYAPS